MQEFPDFFEAQLPAPYSVLSMLGAQRDWELTPGATVVRLIVLDRPTGRYGSLDVPVEDIPRAVPGK